MKIIPPGIPAFSLTYCLSFICTGGTTPPLPPRQDKGYPPNRTGVRLLRSRRRNVFLQISVYQNIYCCIHSERDLFLWVLNAFKDLWKERSTISKSQAHKHRPCGCKRFLWEILQMAQMPHVGKYMKLWNTFWGCISEIKWIYTVFFFQYNI